MLLNEAGMAGEGDVWLVFLIRSIYTPVSLEDIYLGPWEVRWRTIRIFCLMSPKFHFIAEDVETLDLPVWNPTRDR
jgi:hypothetical protein